MLFLDKIHSDDIFELGAKCPQARFLFDDERMVEVALKLVLLNMDNQN